MQRWLIAARSEFMAAGGIPIFLLNKTLWQHRNSSTPQCSSWAKTTRSTIF